MSAHDYMNDTAARTHDLEAACARHGSSATAAAILIVAELLETLLDEVRAMRGELHAALKLKGRTASE